MEKFEEEYRNLNIVEADFDLDDLACVNCRIKCALDDLKYIDNEISCALRRDFRLKFASKTINNFLFIFGMYDEDVYDEDITILNEHRNLIEKFNCCFNGLIDIADEDNCREVLKLAIYTEMKYGDSHDYYVSKRDEYALYCSGINCCMNKSCDADEFFEFFNKKVEEFKTAKVLGLVK